MRGEKEILRRENRTHVSQKWKGNLVEGAERTKVAENQARGVRKENQQKQSMCKHTIMKPITMSANFKDKKRKEKKGRGGRQSQRY